LTAIHLAPVYCTAPYTETDTDGEKRRIPSQNAFKLNVSSAFRGLDRERRRKVG
jgi:hypothetical protein